MSTIDTAAAGIATQQAIARRDVTVSLLKNAANQDQAVANLLEQSVDTVKALNYRGQNVNITA
ncbi:MAG: hypothetical protein LRZ85_07970 [Alphaproteobacteria bacterium]|nr:hypothetical protein [Alphaproteobacteria bacterium]MCD8525711.1 hypothetical protein [Alphaproteobacteria bacterium]MCD8570700.1 hypothetical protein [Alphaproteobacteria bacterium]